MKKSLSLNFIAEVKKIEKKSFEEGYKRGYEAGKMLHDGNCVYKQKDESEKYNEIASEAMSEAVEEMREELIQSPKDDPMFYEKNKEGVIINELTENL